MADVPFRALQSVVREILNNPISRPWSVQGFGMLRTYLDQDKRYRLNIWHSGLAVPGVSTIHDHPWHFTSWIISGAFTNQRFQESAYDSLRVSHNFIPYDVMRIQTGEGGGPAGLVETVLLSPDAAESYRTGDSYSQKADEIHESVYQSGTVTLNDRTRLEDGDHARVFWPHGQKWVDAEPRVATNAEVMMYVSEALKGGSTNKMTLEDYANELWELHHRFMAQSGFEVGSTEDMRFNALAMCGEAGEVANVIKKHWRGDLLNHANLRDELGDVFSYWSHLVKCSGFTFDEIASRAAEKAALYIEKLEVDRAARKPA